MADTIKTIGSTGDYADPILWAAGQGNVNDGNRQVGEMLEDVTMTALFRPNQSWPNGGLLRGDIAVTGKLGDGRTLGNTGGTRICLAPSDGFDFDNLEWDKGANTYNIQNTGNTKITNCLMPDGFVYYSADKTLTIETTLLNNIDGVGSTTQGNVTFKNTTVTDRLIIRGNTKLTVSDTNSLATDWLLGPGVYTGSETLVNYCYILQNAPGSDFGVGSSNNTLNTDTTLEMVNFAGNDFRIKSTSTLATAGSGGSFIGAFLESGGPVENNVSSAFGLSPLSFSAVIDNAPVENNVSSAFSLSPLSFSAVIDNTPVENNVSSAFGLSPLSFSAVIDNTPPGNSVSSAFNLSPLSFSAVIDNTPVENSSSVNMNLGALQFAAHVQNGELVAITIPDNSIVQSTFSRSIVQPTFKVDIIQPTLSTSIKGI